MSLSVKITLFERKKREKVARYAKNESRKVASRKLYKNSFLPKISWCL